MHHVYNGDYYHLRAILPYHNINAHQKFPAVRKKKTKKTSCIASYSYLCIIFNTAMLPFLKPLLDYYVTNHTDFVDPWKVLYQTALKLIEARQSGTANPAKVS